MINVIRAEEQHLEQLTNLFEGYRKFYRKTAAPKEALAFLTARLAQKDSVIFVGEEDGNLTGFVQLYPIFSSTRMQKMWLLNDLFVASDMRGKGISKALINAAKEHCHATNACGLMLETEISNHVGNKLYPATGFVRDTEHYFYFWDA